MRRGLAATPGTTPERDLLPTFRAFAFLLPSTMSLLFAFFFVSLQRIKHVWNFLDHLEAVAAAVSGILRSRDRKDTGHPKCSISPWIQEAPKVGLPTLRGLTQDRPTPDHTTQVRSKPNPSIQDRPTRDTSVSARVWQRTQRTQGGPQCQDPRCDPNRSRIEPKLPRKVFVFFRHFSIFFTRPFFPCCLAVVSLLFCCLAPV